MEIQVATVTATVETHVIDGGLSAHLESVFSSIDSILSIINIFMTMIALVVGVVGMLGFFGYRFIKNAAKNFAEKTIKELLSAEQIRDMIKAEAKRIATKEGNQVFLDLTLTEGTNKSDKAEVL